MQGVGAAGIPVDVFRLIGAGFRVPGDGDGIFGALSPSYDPGGFSEQFACPGGVEHFGLGFRAAVFPLGDIIAVGVQMVDGQRRAVEGTDASQLQLAVSVKIHQYRVAGGDVMDLRDRPVRSRHRGRVDQEGALLAADQRGVVAAVPGEAVAVVFQQAVFDQRQLQLMPFIEGGQVGWKFSSEAGAFEPPVLLVLVAGLQAAGDQIVVAFPVQDTDPVNEGSSA